jgi:EAL domain-containing protein (putative c-di-GMP-specific phosphodiesterase class I)
MAAHEDGEERHLFSGSYGSAITHISIDEALSNNWVDIWYQPKIDLRRKCLAGAEALVRIHHPKAGLLSPEDYLGVLDAESLLRLSEYSVVTLLRHWTVFAEAGFGLRLSINVPASLLSRIQIGALIATHRPQSEKWPGLTLELTEDQIVRDLPVIRQAAYELKNSAVSLAVDEFGAGYSSFSSLRDLPFTELKLHAMFVRNCSADVTNAAICQTAIDLAHRFGSVVVAEGVEAVADLQALIVMGCDLGQGSLLASALPQDRFLDALRQHVSKPRVAEHVPQDGSERVA